MPKAKKAESSSDSDSGPEDRNQPPAKKSKETGKTNSSGSNERDSRSAKQEWILEKLRKVTINEFRGRKMVDIREFYEKNGEYLPGKKGISLSITQWKKLLEHADEISAALDQ